MTIRVLDIEALDKVYAIEQQAHIYPWSKTMLTEALHHNIVMGLYQTHILIGFAIILDAVDVLELLDIAVLPNFQRKGHGNALLKAVIQLAKQKQIPRILLEVRPSNQAAQKLYQRIGFNITHQRAHYYRTQEGFEDALIMEYTV